MKTYITVKNGIFRLENETTIIVREVKQLYIQRLLSLCVFDRLLDFTEICIIEPSDVPKELLICLANYIKISDKSIRLYNYNYDSKKITTIFDAIEYDESLIKLLKNKECSVEIENIKIC